MTVWEWDLSRDCSSPYTMNKLGVTSLGWTNMSSEIRYILMCRRCENCLHRRASRWAVRARNELAMAHRSWFVTLTLEPQRQYWAKAQAIRRAAKAAVTWETLSEADKFKRHCREISPEITRWLKRVRKQSGAPLRYALVVERHVSGEPHFHALVHEVDQTKPVTYRQIVGAWRWGFAHSKLVHMDEGLSVHWYVAKYLAKSSLARVRASRHYGNAVPLMHQPGFRSSGTCSPLRPRT